jgi:hypothetical protein
MKRSTISLLAALVVFGGSLRLASPAAAQVPLGCNWNQISLIIAVSDAICANGSHISDISCTDDEISWTLSCN